MHTHTHTHTHTRTHAHTHTHTHNPVPTHTHTHTHREIAEREAQTEALIAAARDEMTRQLDQEANRRKEMAVGAEGLLERNAELETRLQVCN